MGEQLPQCRLRKRGVHRAGPLWKRLGDGRIPPDGCGVVLAQQPDQHRRHRLRVRAEMPLVVLRHRDRVPLEFPDADGIEHFHPVLGDDGAAERGHAVCGADGFELVGDRQTQAAVGETGGGLRRGLLQHDRRRDLTHGGSRAGQRLQPHVVRRRCKVQRVEIDQEQEVLARRLGGSHLSLREQQVAGAGDLPAALHRSARADLPAEPERLGTVDAEQLLPVPPEVAPVEARFERCRVDRTEDRSRGGRRLRRGRCQRELLGSCGRTERRGQRGDRARNDDKAKLVACPGCHGAPCLYQG